MRESWSRNVAIWAFNSSTRASAFRLISFSALSACSAPAARLPSSRSADVPGIDLLLRERSLFLLGGELGFELLRAVAQRRRSLLLSCEGGDLASRSALTVFSASRSRRRLSISRSCSSIFSLSALTMHRRRAACRSAGRARRRHPSAARTARACRNAALRWCAVRRRAARELVDLLLEFLQRLVTAGQCRPEVELAGGEHQEDKDDHHQQLGQRVDETWPDVDAGAAGAARRYCHLCWERARSAPGVFDKSGDRAGDDADIAAQVLHALLPALDDVFAEPRDIGFDVAQMIAQHSS